MLFGFGWVIYLQACQFSIRKKLSFCFYELQFKVKGIQYKLCVIKIKNVPFVKIRLKETDFKIRNYNHENNSINTETSVHRLQLEVAF